VDVLTLGSYPRLPQDIKDLFISRRELTPHEQTCTLHRLNRIIEYYLAMAARTLSPRISSIVVKNGMAVVTTPGEFEIALTMLREEEPRRWCLLDIKILVNHSKRLCLPYPVVTQCALLVLDVGYGDLVHPKQLHFLHQIVQEKLDNGNQVN